MVVDVQAQEGQGALPFIADGASGLSHRLLLLAPNCLRIHKKIPPERGPAEWELEKRMVGIRDEMPPLISERGAPGHSSISCFFQQTLQRCTCSPRAVLPHPLPWKVTPTPQR